MAPASSAARVIGMIPATPSVPARVRGEAPHHRSLARRPGRAELDRLSAGRDRVVDLLRIVSLAVVIGGHALMLTVSGTAGPDGGPTLGNVLGDIPALQPITWLLQIMPLFFFAGAAAATYGWRAAAPAGHRAAGHWLLARAQRLLRPVGWYLLVALTILAVASGIGADTVSGVVAALGVQLLWFLGAYLLVLAAVPLMQRLDSGRRVAGAVAGCWAVTAAVDAIRLTAGLPGLGYLTFATVWAIPAILGVAYAKRLITVRTAALLATAALAVDMLLVAAGPYDISLVTVPGQSLSNMNPPTLLLAGHTIVVCALAIALRAPLARLVARPRVWWWVVLGNRGAMTLYLWHLPVLGAIIGTGLACGIDRDPASSTFWFVAGAQTVLLFALMVPVTAALSPLENRPLPWWDAPLARSSSRSRDAVVLGCVLVTAVAVLMLARDGLDDGLGWAVLAGGAALLARHTASVLPAGQRDRTVYYSR
ncbi:acyltransferase [Gordonia sinesedis]